MSFDKITENLYVGGSIEDWKPLKKLGLTANLNLQSEHQDHFDGSAPEASLWLPAPDWFGPKVATIETGARYIAMMVEAGHKVYVHCRHGAGRAPIVGSAYLVTTGMDVDEAIQLVRSKRPDFKPNGLQVQNLRKFARRWERDHQK